MKGFTKEATSAGVIMESPYETLTYEIVVEKDVKRDEERRANDRGVRRDHTQLSEI